MSDSHRQPTYEQLQPLIIKHYATWKWLNKMMAVTVVSVFAILILLVTFVA